MTHTTQSTKKLYYTRLRVPKDEAYFVYFTFEANEGMCFYSTIDDSLGGQYRDLDVKCTLEWHLPLEALINRLQEEVRLDVLSSEIIDDL